MIPTDDEWIVTVIGNDEGDDYCSVCGLSDWYQAVQFERRGDGGPWITVVCTRKYEGPSCADRISLALSGP